MNDAIVYDYGIIGGGLSGLTLAIRLSEAGLNVALFERKSYPLHRVCGEYVSMETVPYLKRLGFDPFAFGAVKISRLQVTCTSKSELKSDLDLGGFGLSRYTFDKALADLARLKGAKIFENTHIQKLSNSKDHWKVLSNDNKEFKVKNIVGAQGKRSTIDSFLNRAFLKKRSPYVGIKYHIRYDQANDLIALHNFKNGYCGISRIEDDKYCLCYLASSEDLRKQGSISDLEKNVLMQNPYLADIFKRAEFLYEKALAINEITFSKKSIDENGIKMIGDAAGMIAPLCGNGMAMAIHSSKILADSILDVSDNGKSYDDEWNKHFSRRLLIGRTIQKTFGNNSITNGTLAFFNAIPPLKNSIIKLTHGKEF